MANVVAIPSNHPVCSAAEQIQSTRFRKFGHCYAHTGVRVLHHPLPAVTAAVRAGWRRAQAGARALMPHRALLSTCCRTTKAAGSVPGHVGRRRPPLTLVFSGRCRCCSRQLSHTLPMLLRPQPRKAPRGWRLALVGALAASSVAFSLSTVARAQHGGGPTEDVEEVARLLSLPNTLTTSAGLAIVEVCLREHARELGEQFYIMNNGTDFTACHDMLWLQKFQEISPAGKKVMVDVGANKGYTSALVFALWAPHVGLAPATVREFDRDVFCGNCGDCEAKLPALVQAEPGTVDLQVISVEPGLQTFAKLVGLRSHFLGQKQDGVTWHLMLSAVGNTSGPVSFPRCIAGDEECSLSPDEHSFKQAIGFDRVPIHTIDDLMAVYELEYIDYLKLDCEGFDPLALEGSMRSLMANRIGIISFEYHYKGVWPQHTLQGIVDRMASLNRVCYFSGKDFKEGSLVRLTGCFDQQRFEIHQMANVVAIPRDHPLYSAAERMSTRFHKYPHVYHKLA